MNESAVFWLEFLSMQLIGIFFSLICLIDSYFSEILDRLVSF